MKKGKQITTGAAITLLGALVALTPRYIFPVCEFHGVRMEMMGKSIPMGCYHTARASLLAGMIIGVIGLSVMLAKQAGLPALSLIMAGSSVAVLLIPAVLFPICANPDMHCHHGAEPMLTVLGIMGLMSAAWMSIGFRQKQNLYETAQDSAF